MRYTVCQIKCNIMRQARLPFFKGTIFRDGFSRQFKRASCFYKKGRCDACQAVKFCDYTNYLEMPAQVRGFPGQKTAAPPRPFVIEPPATMETMLPAGAPFDFQLLLFGRAITAAPVFIRALEMMGRAGIGPDRSPLAVKTVSCGGEVVCQFDSSPVDSSPVNSSPVNSSPVDSSPADSSPADSSQVGPAPGAIFLRTEEADIPAIDGETSGEVSGEGAGETQLKLTLLTPLKIKGRSRLDPNLSFQTFTRMMLRRVSLLLEWYGKGGFDVDYETVIKRAGAVRTVASDLTWYDWQANGSRRDKSLLQNSIIGSATFQGGLAPFLPLVRLCRTLHIGRKTEFGLGKFTTEVLTYG